MWTLLCRKGVITGRLFLWKMIAPPVVLLEGHVRPKPREKKKAFYLELFSWDKINNNPIWNSPPILTRWFSLFSLVNTPASSVVNHFNTTPCLPQQHSRKPNIRGHWQCQMVTAANKGKLLGHLSTFNLFFFSTDCTGFVLQIKVL